MPQQQEKQKTKEISTNPSPGLLQRIFGSSSMTPEMEEGVRIARGEIPNMAPVQSYGILSRLLQPNAQGYTSPGRTIYLNPTTMQGQSPQDIADTILHEQTHVNQMRNRGYGSAREFIHQILTGNEPYYRRPDEMEAFQAEKMRRARMGRIQTAAPSFSSGEFRVPLDINLPVETGPSSKALGKIQKKGS